MYSPNLNALMNMLEKEDETSDMPFPLFPNCKNGSATRRKKILLISEHSHQCTTNSKVSWNILKLLEPNFDCFHFGISPKAKANVECRVIPSDVNIAVIEEAGLGFNTLSNYINTAGPDYIIIYNNLSTINQYLMFLNSKNITQHKVFLYVDNLYYNINPQYVSNLNSSLVKKIFVTSQFWKDLFLINKITKPIGVFHYGFDKELMPIIDKKFARDSIKMSNTCFTFLVPCENLQQYRYDIVVIAYVKLLAKYPSKELRLFCLCSKDTASGYSILEIYKQELIFNNMDVKENLKNILLTHDHVIDDYEKHNIFNCADVGICISENEGLNLSSLEMMGVGLPQIVPKSGQFETYCNNSNSIMLPVNNRYYLSRKTSAEVSEARSVNAEDLFLAMEKFLNDDLPIKKTMGLEKYSWSFLAKELLDSLE